MSDEEPASSSKEKSESQEPVAEGAELKSAGMSPDGGSNVTRDDNTEHMDNVEKMKKKKKKIAFKFDEFGDEIVPTGGHAEVQQANPIDEATALKQVVDDLEDLGLTNMKKKKKKKISFNLEALGEARESGNEEAVDASMPGPSSGIRDPSGPLLADDNDDLDFNHMKKKKKKKKVAFYDLEEVKTDVDIEDGAVTADQEDPTFVDASSAGSPAGRNETWFGTDRDYTYEELLQRVFNIMREKDPDMIAGDKRKLVMKPPQVLRIGTKKTSFANFLEITRTLRRTPKHLQSFLMAELGTSGSIDANNQLIIKGRFQQKQIEHVLRRYIKEYVTCHTCRAPETILEKDTRLNFLRCEKCGSRCSVQSIKSGFQAVTTKRAAIRAKES